MLSSSVPPVEFKSFSHFWALFWSIASSGWPLSSQVTQFLLLSTNPTVVWCTFIFPSVDSKVAHELVSNQLTTDLGAPCQLPQTGSPLEYSRVCLEFPFFVAMWCLVLSNYLSIPLQKLRLTPKLLLINIIRLGSILL